MATEIERKFLLSSNEWSGLGTTQHSIQGYLSVGPPFSVRVRIMGDTAKLNLKESTLDIQRSEFEYPIPLQDAQDLLAGPLIGYAVEKNRHTLEHEGHRWEVDEFLGQNLGLVVAEIELSSRDEDFAKPAWLGEEVSGDPRYLNSSLALTPFTRW